MSDTLIISDMFKIKKASNDEWKSVISMAQHERWNLGKGDDSIFFSVDPDGFYIGLHENNITASISIVNFNNHYSHLGHYIVKPDHRGKGFGKALWSSAIQHAGSRCIGLDGMPVQEKNYSSWGFNTDYHTYRLSGQAYHKQVYSDSIKEVTTNDIAAVVDYDAMHTGYRRENLLSSWFTTPGRKAFLFFDKDIIQGLIAIRPSDEGYRIGPFYAANENISIFLLHSAFNSIPKESNVTLDVPEFSGSTLQYLQDIRFKTNFHTCRMYRGEPIKGYQQGINAISSLELG